jgi:hypothetical protein
MAIALADRAAAGSLDGWDIAEYLATELSDSMPVGLATASARRPGMTRLHTEIPLSLRCLMHLGIARLGGILGR